MAEAELRQKCPVLSCDSEVPYSHFACREHWYALPPNLRSKVYHAYASRMKTGKVMRHAEAVHLCREWYRDNGYAVR